VGQEFGQGFEGQLAEPLALGEQPLLEGGRLPSEPREQIPLIEGGRLLERLRGASGRQALELPRIDFQSARIEGDRFARLAEARPGQGVAEDEEGLPEALSRPLVRGVWPQESGELVAWLGLAGPQREVAEERLGLLTRHGHGLAGRELHADAAEHGDA
jgi:hypothetical protein